ncbi:MAG: histone deacetylase family protein [Pseudomonadota bacterium]
MRTVHSRYYHHHDPAFEFHAGELVPPFENPRRAEIILESLQARRLGDIIEPRDFGRAPLEAIHKISYLQFLQDAYTDWRQAGYSGDAIPWFWPNRVVERTPRSIAAKLGSYARAGDTPITESSWLAAYWSAQVAVEGAQQIIDGQRAAFALCRPPGHHASRAAYGGYCFLNNAAIAAAHLRSRFGKVGIIDIDFHHGDGTQEIFYERDDIFVGSIHGEPERSFPSFSGYADECGAGDGQGANLNIPLPENTGYRDWIQALQRILQTAKDHGIDVLVVSLGVDTFENDPISFFRLTTKDFGNIGHTLSTLNKPSLFVLEGGYAMKDLGENVVNVLDGFEAIPV